MTATIIGLDWLRTNKRASGRFKDLSDLRIGPSEQGGGITRPKLPVTVSWVPEPVPLGES